MPITFQHQPDFATTGMAAAIGGFQQQQNTNTQFDLEQQDRYLKLANLYQQSEQFRQHLDWQRESQQNQFQQQMGLQQNSQNFQADQRAQSASQQYDNYLLQNNVPLSQTEQVELSRINNAAGQLSSQLNSGDISPEQFQERMKTLLPRQKVLQTRQQAFDDFQKRNSAEERQKAFQSSFVTMPNPNWKPNWWSEATGHGAPQEQYWMSPNGQHPPISVRELNAQADETAARSRHAQAQADLAQAQAVAPRRGQGLTPELHQKIIEQAHKAFDAELHAITDREEARKFAATRFDYVNKWEADAIRRHNNQFGGGDGGQPGQPPQPPPAAQPLPQVAAPLPSHWEGMRANINRAPEDQRAGLLADMEEYRKMREQLASGTQPENPQAFRVRLAQLRQRLGSYDPFTPIPRPR